MYEKFQTEYNQIEQLFFNKKYFVERNTLSSYFFHSVFKQLLFFKYTFVNIQELNKYQIEDINDNYQMNVSNWRAAHLIDNSSFDFTKINPNETLLEEVKKYCPNLEKQRAYFYIDVYHKNQKLPQFYPMIFSGHYFDFADCTINKINIETFRFRYENIINSFVIDEFFHPRISLDYLSVCPNIGDVINDYLDNLKFYDNKGCRLSLEDFKIWVNDIYLIKDVGLKHYVSIMVDEFIDFAISNKDISKCAFCGELFEYKPTKKYCSEKCKIANKNRKYYAKNAPVIKNKRLAKSI